MGGMGLLMVMTVLLLVLVRLSLLVCLGLEGSFCWLCSVALVGMSCCCVVWGFWCSTYFLSLSETLRVAEVSFLESE